MRPPGFLGRIVAPFLAMASSLAEKQSERAAVRAIREVRSNPRPGMRVETFQHWHTTASPWHSGTIQRVRYYDSGEIEVVVDYDNDDFAHWERGNRRDPWIPAFHLYPVRARGLNG